MFTSGIGTKARFLVIFFVVFATIFASAVSPQGVKAAPVCYVDADSTSPTPDGLSWATAFPSLQDAIASAECTAQIWVATGTYTPSTDRTVSFTVKSGVAFYGGFIGTETDLEDRILHLNDADWTNDTVLSGEIGEPTRDDNSQRVLSLSGSLNPATRLDGFVVTGAYSDEPLSGEGGGLRVQNSVLAVSHMVFRENYALNKGAGFSSSYGQVTLMDVIFELNRAADGGAIYEHQSTNTYQNVTIRQNQANSGGGIYLYDSNSSIQNSTFSQNSTLSGDGGAISVSGGSPHFTDVVIDSNLAQGTSSSRGGGVAIGAGSTPDFTRVTISNNLSNGNGGGVYNSGNAIYNHVTFSHNMAGTLDGNGNPVLTSMGGGMFISGSSPLIYNSIFLGNTAANMGGGISHYFGSGATIANVIFNANRSVGGGGGGIEATGPHASATIINSTFVDNHTVNGYGGGLFAHDGGPEATNTVTNSIFWGNTRGPDGSIVLSQVQRNDPSQLVLTYSDIQSGYAGTGNLAVDPLFVDPLGPDGDAGTIDDNLRLGSTSPLIDVGSNSAVPAGVTTDYGGQARFVDLLSAANGGEGTAPIVDMGAYEVQAPNLQVSKSVSPTAAAEGDDVTYTITVTNTGVGTAHDVTISDPLPANLLRTSAPVLSPAGAGTPGSAPVLFENIILESGEAVTVTYTAEGVDGPATVDNTVSVTADEIPAPGVTDSASLSLSNAAPAVNAGSDQIINEGTTALFSGSYQDPAGSGDAPYTILWTFSGTSETASTLNTSRTYPDQGNFTATLTVTDAESSAGSDTLSISVNNVAPSVNAGLDATINEGGSVTFNPVVSDPGADPLTYDWNFGDGSAHSNQTNPQHTFVDNGTYTVTLTVNDGDGGVTTDTVVVTVNNLDPVANAGVDQAANEGQIVSFNGTATDPAGAADPLSYSWNFGDGTTPAAGQNVTHAFGDEGSYTVTLTVTDGDGGSDTDTLTVTVSNVAPTNVNAGLDQNVDEGVLASFSGSATDPGFGDTLTYSWNFGDGTAPVGGQTVQHAFADNSTYTVTLTVTDGDGGSASDTLLVTVANLPPTIEAGVNQTANEGQQVSFNALVADVLADTLTITWTFGDGGTSSGISNPTHVYADNGSYTVTLTVVDDDGGTSSDTLTVTVNNVAPTANAGQDQSADEGDVVTFQGSATDPAGSADPLTYSWTFGDGSGPVNGQNVQHTYVDEGNYTVTLTVTDGDGGSDTDTLVVTVSNVAPSVELGSNRVSNEGAPVAFSATVVDPGNDTLTYAWTFGDSTTSNLPAPSHTYGDNGIFTVTLTVTDGDGGSNSDSLTVTVNNVAPVLIEGPDRNASEGELLNFTGSASDAGGLYDPLTYTWNFGDGPANFTGQSVSHTYVDNGVYTVTLTVSDGDDGSDSDTFTVTVSNVAPQNVNAGLDRTVNEGAQVSFSGSATDPGGANDPLTYTWDFGDGSTDATGQNVTHTYADNGTFTVTLTVSDGDGGQTVDTAVVTVNNVAPQSVNAGTDATTDEGTAVQFSGSFTDPGAGDTHTITWDFGDGGTATGLISSHAYADDGVYTVTFTVVDDDLASTSDTLIVTVNNVAPVVNAGADRNVKPLETVQFNGSYVDPAGALDQPYTITWNFGDGSSATGVLDPSHVFDYPGQYTVTLTVMDGDEAVGTDTLIVTVSDFAIYLPLLTGGSAIN